MVDIEFTELTEERFVTFMGSEVRCCGGCCDEMKIELAAFDGKCPLEYSMGGWMYSG